jgi:DNA-binding response OmpR family regulator
MSSTFRTILVADDDALTRSAYKSALERSGYRVFTAQDGEEALHIVGQGGVDLLLLDILMPRKEGLETLIEIKKHFPALTVIAMSAGGSRSETDFLAVAAKFGADGTLRKPFTPKTLLAEISRLAPAAGELGRAG